MGFDDFGEQLQASCTSRNYATSNEPLRFEKKQCDECRDRRQLLSILRLIRIIMMISIPSHTAAFPENPSSQVQLYEPSVFLHSAFSPHGLISKEHSSTCDVLNLR